ncbi:TPA: hypothetical protein QDB28_004193 [Burkholderia vietnamiensis]|nr:hypothetical protein [Burkholderia vietnamiensis]
MNEEDENLLIMRAFEKAERNLPRNHIQAGKPYPLFSVEKCNLVKVREYHHAQ